MNLKYFYRGPIERPSLTVPALSARTVHAKRSLLSVGNNVNVKRRQTLAKYYRVVFPGTVNRRSRVYEYSIL